MGFRADALRKWFLAISSSIALTCATPACAEGPPDPDLGRTSTLLLSNAFDKLEAMAAAYRKTDARASGGTPKLEIFYDALASFAHEQNCHANPHEDTFENKNGALERWLIAKPDSIAAHVAMAQLWINYGWKARGCSYIAGVTEEGQRLYVERLTKAGSYLKGITPTADPHIYIELDELARISGSPEIVVANYSAAVGNHPDYFPYYSMRANALEEKWYGQPGDVAAFEKSLLTSPGGATGQIAYAWVATSLYDEFPRAEVFQDLGLDWPALKRAYETKQQTYGLSEHDLNAALIYSSLAHDDDFAQGTVAQIRTLAEKGFVLDELNLGWAYIWGHGVPQSPKDAVFWYRKAAAVGNTTAEYQLGWIYEQIQPEGYPQGYAEALKWYRLAAAQGYPVAKNNLAFLYEHGHGVEQDYAKAAQLYREAADQRNARAAFHLGVMYFDGHGVPKNDGEALKWMELSEGLHDEEARKWLADHAAQFDGTVGSDDRSPLQP